MPKDGRGHNPGKDTDDAAAFAEAVRGARKLGGVRRVSVLPDAIGATPAASRRRATEPSSPAESLTVEALGEAWTARADGVDRRIVRKLRDGEIPVEAQLDLHGLNRAKATAALDRLMAAARLGGRRCLLVIHGRGLHSGADGPALRDMVRDQLTAGPHAGVVLACGSAPVELGGPGATIVYLRR